jgi:competence protein ComGC
MRKLKIQEKLESLRFLAQTHRQQFDERRKYEWKAFYTTLTFLVLIGAAKFSKDIIYPDNDKIIWFLIGSVIILLLISIGFLLAVTEANRKNKSIAEKAENLLADMIQNKSKHDFNIFPVDKHPKGNWLTNLLFHKGKWSLAYQIATLLLIGIAIVLILIL